MFMVIVTGGFEGKAMVMLGLVDMVVFALVTVVAVVIVSVVESGSVAVEVVEGVADVDAEANGLDPQPKTDTVKTRVIERRRTADLLFIDVDLNVLACFYYIIWLLGCLLLNIKINAYTITPVIQ